MMKAKTIAAGLVALCLTVGMAGTAAAGSVTVHDTYGTPYVIGSDEFTVTFNGEAVAFPDAQPYADSNSRTLVPVRFVAETMGADVAWNGATSTATITKGDTTVTITIGDRNLSVTHAGETKTVQMDTVAVGKDGRTFVPIRFVAEALGAWVGYSDLFSTAQIYQDQLTPEEITRLRGYYDMTWEESARAAGEKVNYTDKEWEAKYPEIKYFVGTNGFSNSNEWKLRNPNDVEIRMFGWKIKPENYIGTVSGTRFTFGTQPDIDFSKMILAEAVQGINKEIPKAGTLEANLRADLSCIFSSRQTNSAATYIRGVLDITIPRGANMSWIRQNCDFISSPEEGESRSIDVEVRVNTFTKEVYWHEMKALK